MSNDTKPPEAHPRMVQSPLPRRWAARGLRLWALCIVVIQGCRGTLWWIRWPVWKDVPLARSPWLLGLGAWVWAGLFGLWLWVWKRRPGWIWGFVGLMVGYQAFQWFDLWVLSVSPFARVGWPVRLLRAAGSLVLAMLLAWLAYPSTE